MISDNRWHSLVTRLCGNPPGTDVFAQLVSAYGEPHRHYHNLSHIEHCLREFDEAAGLAEFPDEVELAIWLHDVVYDPKASDNEEKSALWALEILTRSGCADPVRVRVRDLILATRHKEPPASADAALLVDIDLSILGQSPEAYDTYETSIRAEYSWVPETIYVAGRARILAGFLDRPCLYFTEPFETKYGPRARLNLMRAVSLLRLPRKGE